jgi:hypothetical protein
MEKTTNLKKKRNTWEGSKIRGFTVCCYLTLPFVASVLKPNFNLEINENPHLIVLLIGVPIIIIIQ